MTMKRIYGKCEAVILLGIGVAILWFSLSDRYGLLMNPRFRWLTVTGSILLLGMGIGALSSFQKRRGVNIIVFCFMLIIVVLGKPYLPNASSLQMQEPEMEAGLWDQVDQSRFPRTDLESLVKDAKKKARSGEGFTIVGRVKRLDVLDQHGSFAIMTSIMFCCLADAFATGFRVPDRDGEPIEDGQWLMVSGTLAPEHVQMTVPNFRFGTAMLSTIDKSFVIQPDTIMSYNYIDQLPLMTTCLEGENIGLFAESLKKTELWKMLEEKGPFTVFVPVDKAIEALGGEFLENLDPDSLEQFLAGHIVPGRISSLDLMERDTLETVSGATLKVVLANGKLTINKSRLLFKDNDARNGVIHYIYPAIVHDVNSPKE